MTRAASVVLLFVSASAFFGVTLGTVSIVIAHGPLTFADGLRIVVVLAIAVGALLFGAKLSNRWTSIMALILLVLGLGSIQTRMRPSSLAEWASDDRVFQISGVLLVAAAGVTYWLGKRRPFQRALSAEMPPTTLSEKTRRWFHWSTPMTAAVIGFGCILALTARARGLSFGLGWPQFVTVLVVVLAFLVGRHADRNRG